MSEEEESNENSNNEEENEDEENEEGEGEGEENEGEENEDGDEEGEEKEDDEEGEENEDDEGEENEDEEEEDEEKDKKKKKKKGAKKEKKEDENKEEENIENTVENTPNKFPETKLSPTKEIKMDLNLNLNNSDNIYFNGNEITLANIIPKKSTLQLLMEISSEMDQLTTHLERVLPSPIKYNIDYKITNPIITNNLPTVPIIQNYTLPPVPNYDQEDLEIKKLINKANEMTNNSILNKNNNIDINDSMSNKNNNEIKIYEDKGCQSDEELENSYNNNKNEEDRTQQEYYNNNENIRNGSRFPYDPYKHIDYYYNDLRNNNNGNNGKQIPFSDISRNRRMEDFYRGNNSFRRYPIYSQPESNINNMRNIDNQNSNNINSNREMEFQRYRPGSITQAMDILLDKK